MYIFDIIADYVDKLMKKAIQYCITDDNKPTLPSAPPPLAIARTNTLTKTLYHYSHVISTNTTTLLFH